MNLNSIPFTVTSTRYFRTVLFNVFLSSLVQSRLKSLINLQDLGEMDCKPVIGHYTGAGDELDVEDLYTKYKVRDILFHYR